MTITNETLVVSTNPRVQKITETKMTVIVIRDTAPTVQTLVSTGSGQGE